MNVAELLRNLICRFSRRTVVVCTLVTLCAITVAGLSEFSGENVEARVDVREYVREEPFLDEEHQKACIEVASKFVNLIGNFQPEIVEERFLEARKYLSAAGRSEFKARVLESELESIVKFQKSELFVADKDQISAEYISRRNKTLVTIPGRRQVVFRGTLLPIQRVIYEIELSDAKKENGSCCEVLITDFRSRRKTGVAKEVVKELDVERQKTYLESRIALGEISDEVFEKTAQEFVALIANYYPRDARKRFNWAKRLIDPASQDWFEQHFVGLELPVINKKRLSQMFIVDPSKTKISRPKGRDMVLVSIFGLRQTFIHQTFHGDILLEAEDVRYDVMLNTIAGETINPLGILVVEVESEELEANEAAVGGKKRRKRGLDLPPAVLRRIKRDLHEFYLLVKEREKRYWFIKHNRHRAAKRERQQRRAMIVCNQREGPYDEELDESSYHVRGMERWNWARRELVPGFHP